MLGERDLFTEYRRYGKLILLPSFRGNGDCTGVNQLIGPASCKISSSVVLRFWQYNSSTRLSGNKKMMKNKKTCFSVFPTCYVKIHENQEQLTSHNSTVSTLPQAKCLGFMWSNTLSTKRGVEQNINKARKQLLALGSTGCFLGYSNPLSAREIVEICVIPTSLYGAENWILDDFSLNLLERLQAELGRRILKLSKHHSILSTIIGLSWLTMKSRILRCKLRPLGKLISDDRDNIATRTFRMLGSQNVYDCNRAE